MEVFKGEILPSVREQHWVDLKDLKVQKVENDTSKNENLDSAFGGIFPEEVAELQEKDDDYLRAMNIVPVTYAINCVLEG